MLPFRCRALEKQISERREFRSRGLGSLNAWAQSQNCRWEFGGVDDLAFAVTTIPVSKELQTAVVHSFPCYMRAVSHHEAAGLSLTSLLLQEPGWESGHCLGDTAVMAEASGSITQDDLTLLLKGMYFLSTCNPLSKASHGAKAVSKAERGIVKMEMCNAHYGVGQKVWTMIQSTTGWCPNSTPSFTLG